MKKHSETTPGTLPKKCAVSILGMKPLFLARARKHSHIFSSTFDNSSIQYHNFPSWVEKMMPKLDDNDMKMHFDLSPLTC